MGYRRIARLGVTIAMFMVIVVPVAVSASEEEPTPAAEPTPALFEGAVIDMSKDWEGAGACMVWPEAIDTPECFRTEVEMDKRIAELERKRKPKLDGRLVPHQRVLRTAPAPCVFMTVRPIPGRPCISEGDKCGTTSSTPVSTR